MHLSTGFKNKVFWHSGRLNDLMNMDVRSSETLASDTFAAEQTSDRAFQIASFL